MVLNINIIFEKPLVKLENIEVPNPLEVNNSHWQEKILAKINKRLKFLVTETNLPWIFCKYNISTGIPNYLFNETLIFKNLQTKLDKNLALTGDTDITKKIDVKRTRSQVFLLANFCVPICIQFHSGHFLIIESR